MTNAAPKPRRRRWPRFLLIALVVMITPFLLVATTIAATGTVTVRVAEPHGGMNLIVPVPAILLDIAAFAAPRLIPDEALEDIRQELDPWRDSLIEAAKAIEDIPSGVLVETEGGDAHVRITKSRNRFRVRVDSPDVRVNVSLPDRMMRRALQAVDLI